MWKKTLLRQKMNERVGKGLQGNGREGHVILFRSIYYRSLTTSLEQTLEGTLGSRTEGTVENRKNSMILDCLNRTIVQIHVLVV